MTSVRNRDMTSGGRRAAVQCEESNNALPSHAHCKARSFLPSFSWKPRRMQVELSGVVSSAAHMSGHHVSGRQAWCTTGECCTRHWCRVVRERGAGCHGLGTFLTASSVRLVVLETPGNVNACAHAEASGSRVF